MYIVLKYSLIIHEMNVKSMLVNQILIFVLIYINFSFDFLGLIKQCLLLKLLRQ
jgi:hypothetical protein